MRQKILLFYFLNVSQKAFSSQTGKDARTVMNDVAYELF